MWRDFRVSRFCTIDKQPDPSASVRLEVSSSTLQCDEGVITLHTAVAIVPAYGGPYPAHALTDHVQEIVDAYPDQTFEGHLEGHDNQGAHFHVVVRQGEARTVALKIT
ncbi:hypothetical protein LNW73_34820 [Streptomyces sp. RKAG337]|nr:hypothetical protein [Streptomyces sp. RKAG337]